MTAVLADRHQSDLYYSLQLLGDRLGWTVWTPIGLEWYDEHVWQFEVPWDRGALARQYLGLDDRWKPLGGGRYATVDSDHPDRPILGITLPAAWGMAWSHVIASVQQNQPGFAWFAATVGARYVLQVGNTGQQIDWSLHPLVLNSSEMPMLGRHVTYHQEFDSAGTFAFRDLSEPRRIASFVNLMPRIDCWPTLQRFRERLPEFDFRVHGDEGEHGKLSGVHLIADVMAGSGWGWHDKVHGDGFGHVLHNWAAIGRPLIGHGRHYAGKMGEVFWRDGETCIDLDKHSEDEVVALIREISGTPRHAEMCRAIRSVVDEHVDYAREAAEIRQLVEG